MICYKHLYNKFLEIFSERKVEMTEKEMFGGSPEEKAKYSLAMGKGLGVEPSTIDLATDLKGSYPVREDAAKFLESCGYSKNDADALLIITHG